MCANSRRNMHPNLVGPPSLSLAFYIHIFIENDLCNDATTTTTIVLFETFSAFSLRRQKTLILTTATYVQHVSFNTYHIHIIRIRLESIKVIFHVESIANENNNRNTCALAHYVDACILLIYNIYQYSYAMMISWVAERRIKHLLCNVYNTGSFNCGKYYYY